MLSFKSPSLEGSPFIDPGTHRRSHTLPPPHAWLGAPCTPCPNTDHTVVVTSHFISCLPADCELSEGRSLFIVATSATNAVPDS